MNKIYIVEDDRSIRTELAELLNNAGYETEYLTDFSSLCRDTKIPSLRVSGPILK